jgi:methyl-accepting chemotaxis protein
MKSLTGLHAYDISAYYQRFQDMAEAVADLMGGYEDLDPTQRRFVYQDVLQQIMITNEELTGAYTVWKPDTIDKFDRQNIGLPGSAPDGRFAPWYTKKSDKIELAFHTDYKALSANLPQRNVVDEPKPQELNGETIYTLNFRSPVILRRTGEIVGVVGFTVDIRDSQKVVDNVKPYGVGTAALFSHEGYIIAHPVRERVGSLFSSGDTGAALGEAGIAAIHEALTNGVPAFFVTGEIFVYVYPFTISDTETFWAFAASVPAAKVFEGVNTLTKYTISIVLVSIFIAAIIIFFIVFRISKPIVTVSQTLKDISQGEGDLTQQINITSKDEVGDLAHYFNLTLEKIRNLIVGVKTRAVTLFDIGNELSTNMTETAAAINEITSNIQSIRGQAVNQSAGVTETNATMGQITVNINKLNEQIDNQAAKVSQSSAAVEEMLANIQAVTQTLIKNVKNVQKLSSASEIGRAGLQEVVSDIQKITEESEGLLAINSVMENIAGQTNLLSMNAAIEAAHAGEAGKGFAVVSNEIRKLAKSSGEQSKIISGVLKKIKDSIDKITASATTMLKNFEDIDVEVKTVTDQIANIKNAMEEQNDGSKQILEAIGSLNKITHTVKDSSSEMLEGSGEVIQGSRKLEMVTREITNGMHEMANGADQISVAVNRINEISGTNKENIEVLVREVSRFKVE